MNSNERDEPREDCADSEAQRQNPKVVPLRSRVPVKAPQPLDPRLEEMRRLLLESEPLDAQYSDEKVIDDEESFRRRFGPGFYWSERHRRALIALKKRYDLTDPEIRLFYYSGNLKRTLVSVQLTANSWVALWGMAQIAVFGLLFVALLLAVWPQLTMAPTHSVKPLLWLAFHVAFCASLYWLYVKPWILRRQKECARAHAA